MNAQTPLSAHAQAVLDPQRHIATRTDRAMTVGLVQWNVGQANTSSPGALPAHPVERDQRADGRHIFNRWTWAVTSGRRALQPASIYTFPARPPDSYAGQHWTVYWYESDEAIFSEVLGEAWNWRDAGIPAICTHLPESEVKDAIDTWRNFVAPAAAQIIQRLYSPSGSWDSHEWTGAAAKLALGWLAFYERTDAPQTRPHIANRLKLQRIAALALAGYVLHSSRSTSWVYTAEGAIVEDPYAMTDKVAGALERWQATCLNEGNAWVFDPHWWVAEEGFERARRRSRAERREGEMDVLKDTIERLLEQRVGEGDIGAASDFSDRLLALLDEAANSWYRPRYDLASAGRIERLAARVRRTWAKGQPEHGPNRSMRWPLLIWIVGLARLYAGILIGYLATGLSSDTWDLLFGISTIHQSAVSSNHRASLVILAIVCGSIAYLYLFNGIRTRSIKRAARRTLYIFGCGEIFSCLVGVALAGLIAPFFAGEAINVWVQERWRLILLVGIIHAQLALFVGIFTQLFFDERPVTARIEPP